MIVDFNKYLCVVQKLHTIYKTNGEQCEKTKSGWFEGTLYLQQNWP